jgi:membrane protease YdiL (CAAX protease family)
LITFEKTWEYGIYAAYRDVRLHFGNGGFLYKMPTESLADLSAAPFQMSVLKKPEVWGGFLGAFAVAIGLSHLTAPKKTEEARIHGASKRSSLLPVVALPVGIGEEAFFRGYLQPVFSEMTNPTGGLILSSLAFGAMHIPNAWDMEKQDRRAYYKFGIPFITAFGAYFGWVAQKNQSLKEGVALHTWYDFTIFAISAAATETATTGQPAVHVMIPF